MTTGSAQETGYVNNGPPQVAHTRTSAQLSPTSSQSQGPPTPGGQHEPRRGAPAAPRQLVGLGFITAVHTHPVEPGRKGSTGVPRASEPTCARAHSDPPDRPSGPGRCWGSARGCAGHPGGARPPGLGPLLNSSPAGEERRTLSAPPPPPPGAAAAHY